MSADHPPDKSITSLDLSMQDREPGDSTIEFSAQKGYIGPAAQAIATRAKGSRIMPYSAYSQLFSPIRIGKLIAKNRLLMPAMSINFGVDRHGRVTDQLTAYFKARAAGGAGRMVVGGGGSPPQRT